MCLRVCSSNAFPTQAVANNKQPEIPLRSCVCAPGESGGARVYLVNFVPAVLVLAADEGVVVEQELAAAGVTSHHHAVIQRSQTTTVLVVW